MPESQSRRDADGVNTQGPSPLMGFENSSKDSEGDRHHHPRADSLDGAEDDQPVDRRRQAAKPRCHHEAEQPRQVDPLVAQYVTEAAVEEEQAADGEQVNQRYPLEAERWGR